jgi:predicted lipoprotein
MIAKLIRFGSLALLLISLSAHSVPPGAAMTEEQMQQMMKQAEAMQKCFGKIDQSAFQALEAKGKKMETEIKAYCRAWKRAKAESTAMKYGKEMAASKEIQAMKKCGAMAQQMMAQIPMIAPDDVNRSGHVCDNM